MVEFQKRTVLGNQDKEIAQDATTGEIQVNSITDPLPAGTNYIGKTYNEFIDIARNKTQIIKYAIGGTPANTIYTVPSGYTLYITNVGISMDNLNTGVLNRSHVYLDDDGTITELSFIQLPVRLADNPIPHFTHTMTYIMPIKATEDTIVYGITDSGSSTATFWIIGWIE